MAPANPLSVVGLMLTLASLLGSFFYLQLSQWLRDLLALRQKVELNQLQGDDNQRKAIVECRVEFRRLFNWHTYAVNIVVVGFVLFVLGLGLSMIKIARTDPLYSYVQLGMLVFGGIFIVLAGGLLILGATNARWIDSVLKKLS
ncbi:MAG: hypothetical protein R3D68_20530 [Hyphomicrobiaceae bacterium]